MIDDRTDWRPTTASTGLVVFVTLLTATVLVRAIGVAVPAALGGAGAVALALAVWTAGWERHRTLGTVLTSLLALPIGLGVVAATVGTVIVLAGVFFPVESLSRLPATVVDLSARAMVVVGAAAAVFGASVAIGHVLDRDTAGRTAEASLKTTVPPLGVGLVLVASEALRYLEATRDAPGVGAVLGDVLRTTTTIVFEPPAVRPSVTTFLLLGAAALLVVRRTVGALPLTELTTEPAVERAVASARSWLLRAAVLAGFGVPVGFFTDYVFPPERLQSVVTPPVFDLLVAVTTAPPTRRLAWRVIVLCVATLVAVALLRRTAQTSADRIGAAVAPFAAGSGVLVAAALVAGPVLSAARGWVAATLPGEFGPQFRELSGSVVDFYGPVPIVLTGVGFVLLVAAVVAMCLWLVLLTKYLDDRTAGVGIASAALFQIAAFAGVVGVPTALLFGSLVAAVLVWDVGEFGTTLGEEIGQRADTRRAELVHTTGTLAVGGVGVAVAVAVTDAAVGAVTVADGAVVAGLVVAVAGLLALLVALR